MDSVHLEKKKVFTYEREETNDITGDGQNERGNYEESGLGRQQGVQSEAGQAVQDTRNCINDFRELYRQALQEISGNHTETTDKLFQQEEGYTKEIQGAKRFVKRLYDKGLEETGEASKLSDILKKAEKTFGDNKLNDVISPAHKKTFQRIKNSNALSETRSGLNKLF